LRERDGDGRRETEKTCHFGQAHRRPVRRGRPSREHHSLAYQSMTTALSMSHSSEEDILTSPSANPLQPNSNKKRRVQNQRACDRCRLKKSRFLFLWASLFPYSSFLVDTVRCPFARFAVFPSDVHPLSLQAMGLPQAQSVHIVRRLAAIASSQSLQRCAFFLTRELSYASFVHRPEVLRNGTWFNLSWYTLILILFLSHRYVDSLETRLEKMEGMLSRVCRHHP
jgi:hypothetical protein